MLAWIVFAAHAAEPALEWRWESASPVVYHVEMVTGRENGSSYYSTVNEDARALKTELVLDSSCVATPLSKRWEVRCDIDHAVIAAWGPADEQDRLDLITHEYEQTLEGGWVQLQVRRDGRVTAVDLEDVPKSSKRQSQIHEVLRVLMRQAFSPLDFQLPKPDAEGVKEWRQKGSALTFGVSPMSLAGSRMTHQLEGEAQGQVIISSYGEANTSSLSLVTAAQGRFDTTDGVIAYRGYNTNGRFLAAGFAPAGTTPFALAGWIGRRYDDGTVEGPAGRAEMVRPGTAPASAAPPVDTPAAPPAQ